MTTPNTASESSKFRTVANNGDHAAMSALQCPLLSLLCLLMPALSTSRHYTSALLTEPVPTEVQAYIEVSK